MTRKLGTIVAVAVVVAIATSAPAVAGKASGRTFTTVMTGAQEAPGPGDPDATGVASLTLQPGKRTVCYDLSWMNIGADPETETVHSAHIHEAPAGSPGPVVVPLFVEESFSGTDSDAGCVSASAQQIAAIIGNPSNYYVNVHSDTFPAGAIRGQLAR